MPCVGSFCWNLNCLRKFRLSFFCRQLIPEKKMKLRIVFWMELCQGDFRGDMLAPSLVYFFYYNSHKYNTFLGFSIVLGFAISRLASKVTSLRPDRSNMRKKLLYEPIKRRSILNVLSVRVCSIICKLFLLPIWYSLVLDKYLS